MKLSEAIRLGALLKPQGTGELLTADGQSCALGAALDAVGGLSEAALSPDVLEHWPMLLTMAAPPCPACPAWHTRAHMDTDFYDRIVTLNDSHRWTREQIADWVETIEAQQAPEALQALSLVGVGIE